MVDRSLQYVRVVVVSAPSNAVSLQRCARTPFAALTQTGVFRLPQACSACRCSQRLRTHAPFVGVFADTHIPHTTVHILGYRHISACSCALPRLLPGPAASFLQSQSRMNDSSRRVSLVTGRSDRPGPTDRPNRHRHRHLPSIKNPHSRLH
jgi:hypothetical protein